MTDFSLKNFFLWYYSMEIKKNSIFLVKIICFQMYFEYSHMNLNCLIFLSFYCFRINFNFANSSEIMVNKIFLLYYVIILYFIKVKCSLIFLLIKIKMRIIYLFIMALFSWRKLFTLKVNFHYD